jgi:hypothetical protein
MIKLQFYVNKEHVAGQDREWPAVPRIGDKVIVRFPRVNGVSGGGACRVIDAIWDDLDGEFSVAIHLEPPA